MIATTDYIDWIFQTNEGRQPMYNYVALVADATGRYAHVLVPGTTWDNVIDQLENIGCEVIENQTDDYAPADFKDEESMKEVGLWVISDLIKKTNFVPHT